MAKTEAEILATRQNAILDKRLPFINMNLLALWGGRPYIDASLSRFPAESSLEWHGTSAVSREATFSEVVEGVKGRKQRAYLVNHGGRIAERIKQYVFSKPPERDGIDPQFENDVDRAGRSINTFMKHASHLTTACRWCWIGVDMPRVEGQITLARADKEKIRPYWTIYAANEVADWHFDEAGELRWLITETPEVIAENPFSEPMHVLARRLWFLDESGRCNVREIFIDEGEQSIYKRDEKPKIIKDETFPLPISIVPFTLCGELTDKPHWFDDVQDMQAAIMDLESANDTMYFKHVYQQLVLPAGMTDSVTGQTGREDIGKTVGAIVGGAYAIVETGEEKGISRVISPSGDALGKIQDELMRKRQVLFDVVGLHLQIDSKQVESADAKNLDRLDSNAVLAEKAQVLQEAEEKAIKISKAWDSSFAEYQPIYNDRFDVSNLKEDVEAIIMLNNLEFPDSVKRLLNKAGLEKVAKIATMSISDEEMQDAMSDIEGQTFEVGMEFGAQDMGDDPSGQENDNPLDLPE